MGNSEWQILNAERVTELLVVDGHDCQQMVNNVMANPGEVIAKQESHNKR